MGNEISGYVSIWLFVLQQFSCLLFYFVVCLLFVLRIVMGKRSQKAKKLKNKRQKANRKQRYYAKLIANKVDNQSWGQFF